MMFSNRRGMVMQVGRLYQSAQEDLEFFFPIVVVNKIFWGVHSSKSICGGRSKFFFA